MHIHYLEIITDDVEAISAIYKNMYGVTFDDIEPKLGNAYTAEMKNGGMTGIR